jgi:tRNA A-37 threonylcarbamoyl transferase component Bud32
MDSATRLPAASDRFLKSLVDSDLMTAAEASQAVTKVPNRKRNDPRELAQELVKQQKLTKYQAAMLLQGKSKGLVLGNYIVLGELGRGGMGQVFKAQDRGRKSLVALKVLAPSVTANQTALKRFRREARAAAKLHHPNIIGALDAGEAHGVHFFVMEYVQGCDLARHVQEHGPLPLAQALDVVLQAAHGLEHAHAAGIIHRDIKPSNLLVAGEGWRVTGKDNRATSDAPPATVKILDMGLARMHKAGQSSGNETCADELTKTGSLMGTCDFMAPEQALNAKMADHRADIYSLGCTLYFLVTGKPMYDGETAMAKVFAHREIAIPALPGASRALQAVFQRMVAKQPEDRYPSMSALIPELAKCAASPTRRRGRRFLAIAASAGAVAAAAAVLLAVLPSHPVSPPPASRAAQPPASAPVVAKPAMTAVEWRLTPAVVERQPKPETPVIIQKPATTAPYHFVQRPATKLPVGKSEEPAAGSGGGPLGNPVNADAERAKALAEQQKVLREIQEKLKSPPSEKRLEAR